MLLLVCACLMANFAPAEDVRLSAGVNRHTVAPGEEIVYTLKISSETMGSLPSPRLPSFDEFEILYGPNSSQSFQFINGRSSREHSYTVGLRSLKPGKYIIAPAVVETDKGEIKSEAVTVSVTSSPSRKVPSSLKGENIPSPGTANQKLGEYLEGKLFFRTQVNNKSPYVGEPIVVSYIFYARENLPMSSVNLGKPLPQFKSFLKEEIYTAQRVSFRDVKIEGDTYNSMLVKKIILVPTKTGKLLIDPMSMEVGIRVQRQQSRRLRRPFFDDSFFDPFDRNTERVTVPSSVVELNVRPLPAPRPDRFTGTVGDYDLTATLDRRKATMDDLITLSLRIEGQGAVEGAMEPEIPPLEGFEVYETKAKSDKKIKADQLGGIKTFEYVLRPERTGELEIPSISYPIFNPRDEKYVTLKTNPIEVSIAPGTAKEPLIIAGNAPATSKEQVVEINADINYIKRGIGLERGGIAPIIKAPWFLGLQALPILFLLATYLARRRRDALESDVGMARRLRARGLAGRRLKAAEKALNLDDADLFYSELAVALRGFFGDKLNREALGLTIEQLESLLEERGVTEKKRREVRTLLEAADAARYAPASHSTEEMKNHYRQASRIIREFGKML